MKCGIKEGKQGRFTVKATAAFFPSRWFLALGCILGLSLSRSAVGEENEVNAGFAYDKFRLTLEDGTRTEAVGPFFFSEQAGDLHSWGIPPLFSFAEDPSLPLKEVDFAYPLFSYDRYGDQYRLHFFQLLSWAGGPAQNEPERKRFTLFPIYFQQRSSDPSQNYTAVLPFYGHLQNRLFRSEIFVVMFPIYGETRKGDVVTKNYMYPFYHVRRGPGLEGWQLWPFVGREHKDVTTRTNRFGDVETVPGFDNRFVLWPFYYNVTNGIGSENPSWQQGVLPFYALERSPQVTSTTILWPFFSRAEDRQKKYREWAAFWPVVVIARGEGKHITRVWPLFSLGHTPTFESDSYLWPVYTYRHGYGEGADLTRTRILFFLYSDEKQKNLETGKERRRVNLWPFYLYTRDFKGNRRLQVLAPLEPLASGSHKIERDYSPLWSVWREEDNATTQAHSQSLLWNLYRREVSPARRNVSLLFGLFQYQSDAERKRVRLFYLPLGKSKTTAAAVDNSVQASEVKGTQGGDGSQAP